MALVDYTIEDNVAILSMNAGENQFNLPFYDAIFEVLDRIEKDTDANVLVTRSSDKKIWCNGIDLDWLMPVVEKVNSMEEMALSANMNFFQMLP